MLQIGGWVGVWGGGEIVIIMPEALSFAESRRQQTNKSSDPLKHCNNLSFHVDDDDDDDLVEFCQL
jgi:hypothetical protein